MKRSTKKKILTLALVIALLAIVMVGGSLAWFTDTDEATNTFTIGSIEIVQNEYELDNEGKRVEYDHKKEKVLMPVGDPENPTEDDNYKDKIVTVSNTGNNSAYVRTFVAVDARIAPFFYLKINDTEKWVPSGRFVTPIDGVDHVILAYTYAEKLEKDQETVELLEGIYLGAEVDVKDDPKTPEEDLVFCTPAEGGGYVYSGYPAANAAKIDVLVLTQAVQEEGFDDAATALNSAFGVPVDNYNPFDAAEG